MAEYRWNVSDYAAGYDAAAEHIHPHYAEIQEVILGLIPFDRQTGLLVVDAGGGSGRLAERLLGRFTLARVIVIDQSEAFLAIARRRLEPFGGRAECRRSRLQDDWTGHLPEPAGAIVSMSAIHHLDAREKRDLYGRCHDALLPGGVLLNGDEVRAADAADYLDQCRSWAAHMHRVIESGRVPAPMAEALRKWEERNVGGFGTPRSSGDDCHETVEAQLAYLAACGFSPVDAPWRREMWAVLRAVK